MLTIDSLSYDYTGHKVLCSLSLTLERGQIGTLIGTSGSGKTTLLKLLSGILEPQLGRISIEGISLPEACSLTTLMMQEDLLLPWRTALGNLMLIGELGTTTSMQKEGWSRRALDILCEVGLNGWEEAYPHELSGGMRQRISLARALLQQRPLLLLDEPFTSLDVPLRERMYRLLQMLRDQYETTILMVTHDFRDALALSDKICLLSGGTICKTWIVDDAKRKDPASFHFLYEAMKTSMDTDGACSRGM